MPSLPLGRPLNIRVRGGTSIPIFTSPMRDLGGNQIRTKSLPPARNGERITPNAMLSGRLDTRPLPKYHPKSKSFDHVIPLAKGGPHSMDNVKLSHFGCNSRKGAR
jgi:5-methylcytosine-specific restriction endonuclease McrA